MWGYRCFSTAGCFLKTNVSYFIDREMWHSGSVGFANVREVCFDSWNSSGLSPLRVLGVMVCIHYLVISDMQERLMMGTEKHLYLYSTLQLLAC